MRILRTGDLDPALNLALDEALLRSGRETLRLYGWNPPGLSLGFFQTAREFTVPEGYRLVRRPTGGGAIAHHDELTLAWIGKKRRVDTVYADLNGLVLAAVRSLGVRDVGFGAAEPEAAPKGFCFDASTRYDLVSDGGKLFGSAQRRGRDAFLAHGSLVLGKNALSAGARSLAEILGRPVGREEAERAVLEAVARLRGAENPVETPTDEEWKRAERLVSERYGNDAWTYRR